VTTAEIAEKMSACSSGNRHDFSGVCRAWRRSFFAGSPGSFRTAPISVSSPPAASRRLLPARLRNGCCKNGDSPFPRVFPSGYRTPGRRFPISATLKRRPGGLPPPSRRSTGSSPPFRTGSRAISCISKFRYCSPEALPVPSMKSGARLPISPSPNLCRLRPVRPAASRAGHCASGRQTRLGGGKAPALP